MIIYLEYKKANKENCDDNWRMKHKYQSVRANYVKNKLGHLVLFKMP